MNNFGTLIKEERSMPFSPFPYDRRQVRVFAIIKAAVAVFVMFFAQPPASAQSIEPQLIELGSEGPYEDSMEETQSEAESEEGSLINARARTISDRIECPVNCLLELDRGRPTELPLSPKMVISWNIYGDTLQNIVSNDSVLYHQMVNSADLFLLSAPEQSTLTQRCYFQHSDAYNSLSSSPPLIAARVTYCTGRSTNFERRFSWLDLLVLAASASFDRSAPSSAAPNMIGD